LRSGALAAALSFSMAMMASVTALLPGSIERAFLRRERASSRFPEWSSLFACRTSSRTLALASLTEVPSTFMNGPVSSLAGDPGPGVQS